MALGLNNQIQFVAVRSMLLKSHELLLRIVQVMQKLLIEVINQDLFFTIDVIQLEFSLRVSFTAATRFDSRTGRQTKIPRLTLLRIAGTCDLC